MARQKGQIQIEIMQFFLENPEKILTTGEIAEATGINKSVVSRKLKVLTEQLQIRKVKSGHYQLTDFSLSSERSREDNQRTIDKLLDMYDEKLEGLCRSVLLACMKGEHAKGIAMLRGMTDTVDMLLHRWALVHVGYDNNPEQARQDVKLAKARQAASEPEEPKDYRVRHWDAVNKKFMD